MPGVFAKRLTEQVDVSSTQEDKLKPTPLVLSSFSDRVSPLFWFFLFHQTQVVTHTFICAKAN